jgi:hypothetical protein
MLTLKEAEEILRMLRKLPPAKVEEARDFIHFLRQRYATEESVDESDFWTEEDLRDLVASVMDRVDHSLDGKLE